ncbi:glycerophosphodiester phosphodiesterase family protein [Hymenobacter psychrophilus]|uniref:Glycerophosphoryl diester phosphodiesterase n=1 Tax=Hymenobacter psychrophilus TaxID=651662 RepID=A0A1H3MX05_9BACT|nr:glycerophosphodiester phosphodiesterase family protein [Hymenobacter psychrophilus]SDY80509.1 glycerophosphoryl diester phosphodiesterase [Hymenobacter psychrophilus]
MKFLPLFLFLFGTFTATAQTAPLDRQGHRGCRGLMPENTIPAMRKAQDLGVTTLEMDVLVSQDNQLMLSHDPFLNADFVLMPNGQPIAKTEEQQHRLYDLPYAEIRRYDVGSKLYAKFPRQQKLRTYKPLLTEVIDSAEAYARLKKLPAPHYNIETKTTPAGDGTLHPAPEPFVDLLLAVVRAKGIAGRVTVQSFDPRTLELVHKAEPTWRTALLVENLLGLDANLHRLSFRPSIYSPAYRLVTAALVAACHKNDIQVIAWTVNSAAAIEQLMQLRVDGIITDYPDLFITLPNHWPEHRRSRP